MTTANPFMAGDAIEFPDRLDEIDELRARVVAHIIG
jgi:hypothetical protein